MTGVILLATNGFRTSDWLIFAWFDSKYLIRMEMSYAILIRQANNINLQRNYLTNGNMTLYWQQHFLKIHVGPMLLFQKPLNKIFGLFVRIGMHFSF